MDLPIGTTLLRWYKKQGRDLPWRHTRNPYHILISEVMLQQTQVQRVIPFYYRWLERFPDWRSLAIASNGDVIKAWSGLGYNRRGLVLRDIAKHVHSHGEPTSEAEWLILKGIGPYTAAAISAFAYQKRTLPIDTNIRRVLARYLFGIHFPDQSIDDRLRNSLDLILPKRGAFYDVPQAIFDLATSFCTKKPQCSICPLRMTCRSAKSFLADNVIIPKQSIKKANESRHRNKPYPDRIFRGRILKLVQKKRSIALSDIGPQIDSLFDPSLDSEWIQQMIKRMEKDGMIELVGGRVRLKV